MKLELDMMWQYKAMQTGERDIFRTVVDWEEQSNPCCTLGTYFITRLPWLLSANIPSARLRNFKGRRENSLEAAANHGYEDTPNWYNRDVGVIYRYNV